MAPNAFLVLTCFSHDADVHVQPKENPHGTEKRRRRWTGEIKRKILATARRRRIWAVGEEQPCDVDVEKQTAQAPEPKATPPLREGAPVSQSDRSPSNDDGAPAAAVADDGRRKREEGLVVDHPPAEISGAPVEPRLPTGVLAAVDGRRKRREGRRVRFDLPPQEMIISAAAAAAPVEPRFPTGVLGKPPASFARAGADDMTAAFLMSVIAEKSSRGGRADRSSQVVDGELVARWTERKAACSRRLRYLRDYCPFRREEEEEEEAEDEESKVETTTTTARPEAEPEVWPVKTGLPFDSPESEAEFVKAIRSRYLLKLKDDFLFRHAYETGCQTEGLGKVK